MQYQLFPANKYLFASSTQARTHACIHTKTNTHTIRVYFTFFIFFFLNQRLLCVCLCACVKTFAFAHQTYREIRACNFYNRRRGIKFQRAHQQQIIVVIIIMLFRRSSRPFHFSSRKSPTIQSKKRMFCMAL